MIARIVTWAVEKRWLVLLLTVIVAAIGAFSLYRLPIDAVPDITNNQVQINVRAPALSPELVEKQVSFPIETALAGTPGLEYTRSLSRNGFAQITAVFSDATDIYFARQQVGERLQGVQENLPDGVNPEMGPIATGLGEVYMYRSEEQTSELQPLMRISYAVFCLKKKKKTIIVQNKQYTVHNYLQHFHAQPLTTYTTADNTLH